MFLFTSDLLPPRDDPLDIREEVHLAVQVAAIQRKQIVGVGLARHAINAEILHHLGHPVVQFVRMEVGRPKFDIQIGHTAPDPPTNDLVPCLVGAYNIPLRGALALRHTPHHHCAQTPDDPY